MQVVSKECKYGILSFYPDDEFVGRSLEHYGEYSEDEVKMMSQLLRPGDTVVEVGANIGSLTVPMARMIGPKGKLIAFEAHPNNFELLLDNVANNDVSDTVDVHNVALSDHNGTVQFPRFDELDHRNYGRIEIGSGSVEVNCMWLDDLKLEKLRLLKVDVEGHELPVLKGARDTIMRLRPIIYVENDRQEKAAELINYLVVELNYRLYWHLPPLWNKENFAGSVNNVFGEIVSLNMLCVPEERSSAHIEGLDEVADLTIGPDMYEREIARYTRIVDKNPSDLRARLMLAHFHNLLQHNAEADALIAENLRRDPNDKATLAIQGLHFLQQGRWKEGWERYELRYEQKTKKPFGYRPHHGEKWDGEPTNEPLLVWCEQGYGDMLMLARLWPRVKALAPNAFMEIHAGLHELFEISGIKPVYRMGRTLPDYTKHISIPSLCYALKCFTDESFRSFGPYLKADPLMVEKWIERNAPKIGICCKGSPISERPHTRNIDHNLFRSLTKKYGPFLTLEQEGQFPSYADTAACISTLDLVITVDTSVAHLAGALGIETWLLLSYDPDWRWGLKGDRTIWYETMRIFRQPKFGDWDSVVRDVEAAFEDRKK